MTCPSPLVRSMYADDALAYEETATFERHLHDCERCVALVAALRAERSALRSAWLAADDAAIPAFAPHRSRLHAAAMLALVAVGATAAAFWQSVASSVPSALRWLNPFAAGELAERAVDLTTFVIYEGSTMWSTWLDSVGAAVLVALALWLSLSLARSRGGGAALALSVLVVALALPTLGHALEVRRGEGLVTLPAGETIDDTLLAAGETVAIDGDVNGDLLAFGRSVTIRGNVAGNVVSAAETITIEGTVGGSVVTAGRAVTLASARVARNWLGLGRDLELGPSSEVRGNVATFGESVDADGRVGVDLKSFGNNVTISGNVERNVDAFAENVALLPSARVGGNLTTHTEATDKTQVASGAVVGGRVDRQIVEREQRRNRYATAGFYVRQVVRLGAAFVTGLLLFWLFPALRTLELRDIGAALRSGGIGLAATVTLPVLAVLLCVTVVGIPVGIATFVLGALGLYFAKAVIAQLIGRRLFRSPVGEPHYAATLLAGLTIVIVAINVPLVGGILNAVATLVGFGMIVTVLYAHFARGRGA